MSGWGLHVLPPDINESRADFTYLDDQTIRFGLAAIKNLGSDIIASMIEERESGGEFVDLSDLLSRVHHRAFNKKSLEALIKAGALDRFGRRTRLLGNMDSLLAFNKQIGREKDQQQTSLFDLNPDMSEARVVLKDAPDVPDEQVLAWEREMLGLYVSAHPYDPYHERLGAFLQANSTLSEHKDRAFVKVGGFIGGLKEINTKKGDAMAFVTLEDMSGAVELVVFPKVYAKFKHMLLDGALFVVSAQVSKETDGSAKLLARSFIPLSMHMTDQIASMLEVGDWYEELAFPPSAPDTNALEDAGYSKTRVPQPDAYTKDTTDVLAADVFVQISFAGIPDKETVAAVREILKSHPGRTRVCLELQVPGDVRVVQTEYHIDPTNDCLEGLRDVLGVTRVEHARASQR